METIDKVYVIDAEVSNSEGESAIVYVSTLYSPITKEWKSAYREIAIGLAADLVPILTSGMRVRWIETEV